MVELPSPAPPPVALRGEEFREKLLRVREEIETVIIGQTPMVLSMICTMLAKGHLLLEGVPGLAKSLAVSTFARTIRGEFNRIQFTPDKLPGDITGTMVFEEKTASFVFHKGPIFCNLLLADEINRAAPKVQSALLEAMQEKAVSIDREHFPLPDLFMVLATQNPVEQLGTYPLSEAQLDRFMVKVDVTYPTRELEKLLLLKKSRDFEVALRAVRPLLDPGEMVEIQEHVATHVEVSEPLIAYVLEICRRTRPEEPRSGQWTSNYISIGASPRAGEHLLAYSKSFAFLKGRDYVSFDDIDRCAAEVLGHRIILKDAALLEGKKAPEILAHILRTIVPYGAPGRGQGESTERQ